jgi:hypothetical protein
MIMSGEVEITIRRTFYAGRTSDNEAEIVQHPSAVLFSVSELTGSFNM